MQQTEHKSFGAPEETREFPNGNPAARRNGMP